MTAVGIIGEDDTDVRTIEVLLRSPEHDPMIPRSVGIRVRSPSAGRGGCAALRRNAASYMKDLQACGCVAIVFLHDLDLNSANGELNDEAALRTRLAGIEVPRGMERLICIPVEELEAWFWSDQRVLDAIGDGGKASDSPHRIKRPKERLKDLSARGRHKAIYSTAMNKKLARDLDQELCARRCPAFAELREFMRRLFPRTGA